MINKIHGLVYSQLLANFQRIIITFKYNPIIYKLTTEKSNNQQNTQIMNIKISIKDHEHGPTCISRQISEVQHKKRTMLYGPPQSDKGNKKTVKHGPQPKKRQVFESKQYQQTERQFMKQYQKHKNNGKANNTSTPNSQKQHQILQQNQKVLQQQIDKINKEQQMYQNGVNAEAVKNQVKESLDMIKNQVLEIKKIRGQIFQATQQFNKNINEKGRPVKPQISQQISQMNQNMKNIAHNSHEQLLGLQNLQSIKALQNFNVEGYIQSINTLKKQIAQYMKQSQNIERQLKIRLAKLDKLEVPPKFQQELYKPYQQHLNNRIKTIDLHAIRDRVYQKIGNFDYGKFQSDIGSIMVDVRNQMSNFPIICKQHTIVVPEIRIDPKQLKNMQIKIPSVLDQYKAAKGIIFQDHSKKRHEQKQAQIKSGGLSKTNQIQQRLKQQNPKKPDHLRKMPTKPIDLANQTKLTKQSQKKQTILQNEKQKQKRQLQQRIKLPKGQQRKQDQKFEKYLQNRARQQLQILYKQKKQRLEKMQNELYQQLKNPVYLEIDLDTQQLKKNRYSKQSVRKSPKKTVVKQKQQRQEQQQKQPQNQYQQQFQPQEQQQQNKQINVGPKRQTKHIPIPKNIKQLGRDILKQKLKNLLGNKNKSPHVTQSNLNRERQRQPFQPDNFNSGAMGPVGERQVTNIAEGFINMINNTLTQVNNNLHKAIQKRIQYNSQRQPSSLQRREPRKISVPKLQSFRPPPVFNINVVQPSPNIPIIVRQPSYMPTMPSAPHTAAQTQQKKIVVENYDKYKVEDENFNDYQISSDEEDD